MSGKNDPVKSSRTYPSRQLNATSGYGSKAPRNHAGVSEQGGKKVSEGRRSASPHVAGAKSTSAQARSHSPNVTHKSSSHDEQVQQVQQQQQHQTGGRGPHRGTSESTAASSHKYHNQATVKRVANYSQRMSRGGGRSSGDRYTPHYSTADKNQGRPPKNRSGGGSGSQKVRSAQQEEPKLPSSISKPEGTGTGKPSSAHVHGNKNSADESILETKKRLKDNETIAVSNGVNSMQEEKLQSTSEENCTENESSVATEHETSVQQTQTVAADTAAETIEPSSKETIDTVAVVREEDNEDGVEDIAQKEHDSEDESPTRNESDITYERDFLLSRRHVEASTTLAEETRDVLTQFGILKTANVSGGGIVRESESKLPKVVLTPQRKTFERGCSWRNKTAAGQEEEGETDSLPPSSAILREEEMFGFMGEPEQDFEQFSDGFEYTKGSRASAFGRASGTSQHSYGKRGPAGIERGARGPKKIDHIPLKDQESAGRKVDYGKRDVPEVNASRQHKSFADDEPEWMTFEPGCEDENFDFSQHNAIEDFRNEMRAKEQEAIVEDPMEESISNKLENLVEVVSEEQPENGLSTVLLTTSTLADSGGPKLLRDLKEVESIVASGNSERVEFDLTDEDLAQILGFQLDEEEKKGNDADDNSTHLGRAHPNNTWSENNVGSSKNGKFNSFNSGGDANNPTALLKKVLKIDSAKGKPPVAGTEGLPGRVPPQPYPSNSLGNVRVIPSAGSGGMPGGLRRVSGSGMPLGGVIESAGIVTTLPAAGSGTTPTTGNGFVVSNRGLPDSAQVLLEEGARLSPPRRVPTSTPVLPSVHTKVMTLEEIEGRASEERTTHQAGMIVGGSSSHPLPPPHQRGGGGGRGRESESVISSLMSQLAHSRLGGGGGVLGEGQGYSPSPGDVHETGSLLDRSRQGGPLGHPVPSSGHSGDQGLFHHHHHHHPHPHPVHVKAKEPQAYSPMGGLGYSVGAPRGAVVSSSLQGYMPQSMANGQPHSQRELEALQREKLLAQQKQQMEEESFLYRPRHQQQHHHQYQHQHHQQQQQQQLHHQQQHHQQHQQLHQQQQHQPHQQHQQLQQHQHQQHQHQQLVQRERPPLHFAGDTAPLQPHVSSTGAARPSYHGLMPTSVMRRMATQSKQAPVTSDSEVSWQTKASLANAARLEQALTDQATKTHETLSDMLIFADNNLHNVGGGNAHSHHLHYPPDLQRGH